MQRFSSTVWNMNVSVFIKADNQQNDFGNK